MRGLPFVVGFFSLVFLTGCERLQTGKMRVTEVPTPPPAPVREVSPPAPPITPQPPGAEKARPTPIVKPTVERVPPTPKEEKAPQREVPPRPEEAREEQKEPEAPKKLLPPLTLREEAQTLRVGVEALQAQFEELPPEEVRVRIVLLNQALSELEARLPGLVLWRTALQLKVLRRTALPDTPSAKRWLARAKKLLADVGYDPGIKAVGRAEEAIEQGDWKEAVTTLETEAEGLKATEQAQALMKVRQSFLNALEALKGGKRGVARAEIKEAWKALNQLVSGIS